MTAELVEPVELVATIVADGERSTVLGADVAIYTTVLGVVD